MEDFNDLGLDFEEEGISILSAPVKMPSGDSGGASSACAGCAGCVGCIGEVNCTNG